MIFDCILATCCKLLQYYGYSSTCVIMCSISRVMFVYYVEFSPKEACIPKRLACAPAGDCGFLRSDCGASVARVSGLFAWQVILTCEIM